MSLANETVMPVVPAGYGGSSDNNGWGGDGAWWIIILFLFVFCGWGNGFGNNGGGSSTQGYDTRADVQRGFDTQAINTKLDGITNGMCQQGYQNQQGFHDVDNAVCQLGYQIQGGVNDLSTTMLQGQNSISSQIANCCCETRESIQGVNYNLATQVCGLQNTMNNNTRDILENQNSNTRAVLDYLCNDKIEALRSENQSLKLAASQSAQNATLISAMTANTNEVLNRAAPTPVPAYAVPAPYPYNGASCCGCSA